MRCNGFSKHFNVCQYATCAIRGVTNRFYSVSLSLNISIIHRSFRERRATFVPSDCDRCCSRVLDATSYPHDHSIFPPTAYADGR